MGDLARQIQYMTAEEYERLLEERQRELIKDDAFRALASAERIPKTHEFTRKDVVNAFQNAFQLIGSVTRLALWADANPTEFYKLYARLLPSQASAALGENNEIVVRHVIERSKLDEE